MSILNIRWYPSLAHAATGERMPVGLENGYVPGEDVTYVGATRGDSSPAPGEARMARLIADTDVRVAFNLDAGADPGAGDVLMRAGSAEYFGIAHGVVISVVEAV